MMFRARRLIGGKRWLAPILLLMFSRASSQEAVVRLTVEQAITAALANNKELKLATLDEKIAGARYKETEAVFLPQAGVSYSAMTTNNPLNAFGFKLQQQTITSGDFNPDQLNHPGGTPDFMARVDVQQPLVNMDQFYLRKSAAKGVEVYRMRSQRTKEGLVFEVSKAYMQLQLANESVKVLEEALATAGALYRYTSDRVDQGMLNKADALNAKVQVATMESRLAEAKSQVKNASDYLSLLMGRPYGASYAVDSNSVQEIGIVVTDSIVPAGRADLSALQKAIEASDLGIRSRKMSALPRLNAFGSYQLNDSRMFGFGANAYLAGIQLSWDIFKGNSIRNKIATQTLERNKLAEELSLRKDQSNLELNKAQRQLADARYRIRQQQAAVASAAESFRILKDRFEQALAGSTDVLLAQNQVSQQRLALAQAIFDQQVAIAYIQFITTPSAK
ncbi:TolC family protein [Flavitalea sp. BT771]|uniref:TolC family protein n=1 Tax=Flavitalea sp. BT771 TaxID=3063329 RepID=UPI0026E342B1|nr:TolC family protein [Flavitalea sp. BT771]MDO6430358.1 TolC family protein [Flavitalea sp. BT771]MDV6219502.1 TolC family protein [Flavitalea sp. BT771]